MATVSAIECKTQSKTATKKVIDYVAQNKKTMFHDEETGQKYQLISGQNCVAETAYKEFMATKIQHGKNNGVFYRHYVQSFKPDKAISPKLIHQMGIELAEYFKGFEVLIATHIDDDHWHSHFVVNSVNAETGLKIQFSEKSLSELRQRSDEICQSHGLETLKPYQKDSKVKGMSTREYRAAERGNSWKFKLMNTIDSAMSVSTTKSDFIANMEKMGYGVKWEKHHKYITYTTPDNKRCRDNRLHDEKYLKERMEEHFEFGQIQGIEQNEYTVNGTGRIDEKLSSASEYATIRDTAGSIKQIDIYDNGSRKTSSTDARKNRRVADVDGLDERDTPRNKESDGWTPGSRQSIIKQLKPSIRKSDRHSDSGTQDFNQRQIIQAGGTATSTGQHADKTQMAVDRRGSGVADAVIGAVVALEKFLDVDQPEKEQQPKQIVERRKGKKKNQNKSNNWEMTM